MGAITILKQQRTPYGTLRYLTTRIRSKNKITNQLKQRLIKTLITEWGIWSNH